MVQYISRIGATRVWEVEVNYLSCRHQDRLRLKTSVEFSYHLIQWVCCKGKCDNSYRVSRVFITLCRVLQLFHYRKYSCIGVVVGCLNLRRGLEVMSIEDRCLSPSRHLSKVDIRTIPSPAYSGPQVWGGF